MIYAMMRMTAKRSAWPNWGLARDRGRRSGHSAIGSRGSSSRGRISLRVKSAYSHSVSWEQSSFSRRMFRLSRCRAIPLT